MLTVSTKATKAKVTAGRVLATEDADYHALHVGLRNSFVHGSQRLFTTNATGLFDAFLAALPASRRQHYRCNSCRKFVDRFGGLVSIDESGRTSSPFWNDLNPPPFFAASIRAMSKIVAKAKVTGVFASSEKVWAIESNRSDKAVRGAWFHMHSVPNGEMLVPHSSTLTPDQIMAEKVQEYEMLCRGLADFPAAHVKQAHTLLTTGQLYRSEKCIGVAQWLLDLHDARDRAKSKAAKENVTWLAVASAPVGFCHVRNTVISTLLEDVAAGKSFADIKRAFDSKLDPRFYQRPQAAPSDGQLAAAEKLVEKLDSAGSLNRRYATLKDVIDNAIWTPSAPKYDPRTPKGGVFGHLSSRADSILNSMKQPPMVMTWEKFERTVLPNAEKFEYHVPNTAGSYFAFVTAVDKKAPPILQWDTDAYRNPVSWYLHMNGSLGYQWGLAQNAWCEVTAITKQPSSWGRDTAHQGDGAYFILKGARDLNANVGLALFPEILKSDYHGIRSAIEAYSSSKRLSGADKASACGVCLQKSGGPWGNIFRATTNGVVLQYKIDRWD